MFYGALGSYTPKRQKGVWLMNGELELGRKRAWHNRGTIPAFTWGDGNAKISVGLTGALVEIRTEHLPNRRLEHYRYAIPTGLFLLLICFVSNATLDGCWSMLNLACCWRINKHLLYVKKCQDGDDSVLRLCHVKNRKSFVCRIAINLISKLILVFLSSCLI
jgi:hypothetical protein